MQINIPNLRMILLGTFYDTEAWYQQYEAPFYYVAGHNEASGGLCTRVRFISFIPFAAI